MTLPSKSLLFSLVLLSGCFFGSKEVEGDTPGECTDGADNDQNGAFDCLDPGCSASPDCDLGTDNPTLGTGPTTTPTTTTTTTNDTSPFTGQPVASMTLEFYLATNNAGRTTTVDWGGYAQPSMLILNFGTATWGGDPAATSQYCSVSYFLDDRTNIAAANAGYWFGISGLDVNDAVSDCEAFDPNFSTDYITDFGSGTWNIYIGGEVSQDISDNFDPISDYSGGEINGDLFADAFPTATNSLQTNNNSVVTNPDGSGIVIPAAQVQSANGVVSGLHIGIVPWIFSF